MLCLICTMTQTHDKILALTLFLSKTARNSVILISLLCHNNNVNNKLFIRDSVVGVLARLGVGRSGNVECKKLFFSSNRSDFLWGLIRLLFNGYHFSFPAENQPVHVVDHQIQTSAESMNGAVLYTPTPPRIPACSGYKQLRLS